MTFKKEFENSNISESQTLALEERLSSILEPMEDDIDQLGTWVDGSDDLEEYYAEKAIEVLEKTMKDLKKIMKKL